jgi:hypothetical protein
MRISPRLRAATYLIAFTVSGAPSVGAQKPIHPLDELSSTEYWAVYETLRADARVGAIDLPH